MLDLDRLDFEKGGGLVTVVAQDVATGAVLMLAHADREALERTISSGQMHYRSRTRGLWHKGATSGNTQRVVELRADCDGDAVLALVEPAGPACHTGRSSCFDAPEFAPQDVLGDLDRTIAARAAGGSDQSYTRRLLGDRNLRLKKVGEEAAELVLACADENVDRAVNETADLWYHSLVALRALGGSLAPVLDVLRERARPRG
ncbi:MAG: bifunctional phosphoribosyl-AMP cyclohydrolase/phosphoribosyl-ATP diphosphatase HisIE [Gemmatimonadota bacterium]|nr:bifunctional phosphoribosyl-AMP cyclohydrolase/phosphoribosyl-ATP diphosphatase HisIE [Gemmatimonadota bacterium]MDE3126380.1 bifunctional phosphoribosyl-AMP cyclohydrolase/phosphoribosyl-ATP diphosphatase HisIE [Gemmatimonadota bacterium]MDE3171481.1 bifunctional phosphoribosyl-AMP cyclohydrolase/phosphoribosyl-ATP diphosphatase HisIE [Gemmatimonadota bacterium]MDE3215078.1 bifunctional phosphoribosyl-AMP cyclohydrolase/phosphoribosyl-ATP diphosphatase HisIE [Gemmatimonadota bacterium]